MRDGCTYAPMDVLLPLEHWHASDLVRLPARRAIHTVPHLSMLLSAHGDGCLRVWPLPRPHMQLLELPHSATPRWHLPHGTVRAHRSSVTALDRWGTWAHLRYCGYNPNNTACTEFSGRCPLCVSLKC